MPSSLPSLKQLISGFACLLLTAAAQPPQEKKDDLAVVTARSVPLGVENKGITLPAFDSTGRRTSLMTASVVRRIDDERLYAETFAWQQFAADPTKNLHVELPSAFYNMATATLRSTQRGKISRADFQVEGDRVIFDTKTNCAKMEGNIRMVIFDTSAKSGEKAASKP